MKQLLQPAKTAWQFTTVLYESRSNAAPGQRPPPVRRPPRSNAP